MKSNLTRMEIFKKITGAILILIGCLSAFSFVKQSFIEPSDSYTSFNEPPPAGYFVFLITIIFVCFKYGLRLYNGYKKEETEITSYECIHCKYKNETDFTFCPKCKKDDNGLTIEEINQKNI